MSRLFLITIAFGLLQLACPLYGQDTFLSPTGRQLTSTRFLGSGAMTDVYEVTDNASAEKYAFKIVKPKFNMYGDELIEGYRDIGELAGLAGDQPDFPFIDVIEAGEFTGSDGELLIGLLMPVMEYPTLYQEAAAFSLLDSENLWPTSKLQRRIDRLYALMQQMFSIAEFLGKWEISVNDIKPQNMILVGPNKASEFSADAIIRGEARLILMDYDFVSEFGKGRFCGTRFFCAPERFPSMTGEQFTARNLNTDLYSLGGSLYAVAFNIDPWNDFISDSKSKGTYIGIGQPDFEELNEFMTERFDEVLENIELSEDARAKLRDIRDFVAESTKVNPKERLKYLGTKLPKNVRLDLDSGLIYKNLSCSAAFGK